MITTPYLRIIIPAIAGFFFSASLYAADAIDSRIQLFKAMKTMLSTIDDAVSEGKLDTVATESRKLATFAATLPDLFPADSSSGHGRSTKASDSIWSHFPDFEVKANALLVAAEDLAVAAESGDSDATRTKLDTTRSTCKACHRSYKDFW